MSNDLNQAITLYLPDHIDRIEVSRLVKAMCTLNGIPVAIEMHPHKRHDGSDT